MIPLALQERTADFSPKAHDHVQSTALQSNIQIM